MQPAQQAQRAIASGALDGIPELQKSPGPLVWSKRGEFCCLAKLPKQTGVGVRGFIKRGSYERPFS
jgi:hypothetical protein